MPSRVESVEVPDGTFALPVWLPADGTGADLKGEFGKAARPEIEQERRVAEEFSIDSMARRGIASVMA